MFSVAVSYTHLDVYKRQVLRFTFKSFYEMKYFYRNYFFLLTASALTTVLWSQTYTTSRYRTRSVSYTHLLIVQYHQRMQLLSPYPISEYLPCTTSIGQVQKHSLAVPQLKHLRYCSKVECLLRNTNCWIGISCFSLIISLRRLRSKFSNNLDTTGNKDIRR